MNPKKRIVAEISRNWRSDPNDLKKPLVSQSFEEVIENNRKRGFVLESWQLSRIISPNTINETIIAVFVENTGT